MVNLLKHKFFILFFLWFILTAINIDKAFHIDDTFHLESSDWIKNNPGKPMSGLINWFDDPAPIYTYNNPPLFFYLIAVTSSIFGNNEIPLHLLISIFTFLALYYFYKLAEILSIQKVNTLLVLFAFCPALIVNQNLMLDVPILALTMGSVYFLFKGNYENKLINYSLSSLLLGLGLLIKYSLLPLLVVLILVILIRRQYKILIVLLIPISMICLWSFWNYIEFGSIHILGRPKEKIIIDHFWEFIACLGSISIFSISLVFGTFPFKIIKNIIYFVFAVFFISVILFFNDLIPVNHYSKFLSYLFFINGALICITLIIKIILDIKTKRLRTFLTSDGFVLLLFISAISSFIILFSPFMATRHILLVIPFILLFAHKLINNITIDLNRLLLTTTITLGLLLGISDWKYANYYRQMASAIDLPKDRNIWTAGHWGWQWYSKINGMQQYSTNQSNIKEGDYFVYPENVCKQNINKNIKLIVVDKKWKEANILSFFSVNKYASLYDSSFDGTPWRLSKAPIDTIIICKIRILKKDTI